MQIIEFINAILPLVIGLVVLSFPVFFIVAILKFFELKNITDASDKSKQKKKAWKILLFPILIIVFIFVLVGILNVIQAAIQGA